MTDDRNDFQRGRREPAWQRGHGATVERHERRAEREPRSGAYQAPG